MNIIPKNIRDIISQLKIRGYDCYIVGGAVREYLFNKNKLIKNDKEVKITDFDLVTNATSEQIQQIFGDCVTCGNNFLVTLVDGVEIATYRKDKDKYAEVASTLKEDVIRRDFTINGICFDITTKKFIDHVGGISDIVNRKLRFIGGAERRINEDPARILRAIRFCAKYNLTMEEETYFALFQHRQLIKELPSERIQREVIKAFKDKNTHRFLTLLEEMEMLDYVFPSLCKLRNLSGGKYHNETVLNHCFNAVKAIDEVNNWKLKLAALYHDIGKWQFDYNDKNEIIFFKHNQRGSELIKNDLSMWLKMPNDVVDYVVSMKDFHMDCIETPKSVRKLMIKLTDKKIDLKDFILLRFADNKGCVKEYTPVGEVYRNYGFCQRVMEEKPPTGLRMLAIDGNDIMQKYDLPQGKIIGEYLQYALDKVTDGECKNTQEDIYKVLDELIMDEDGNILWETI